jgi:hypothetical protein
VAERNLLELLGAVEGLKAVVRLPLADEDWPVLCHYCAKLGLCVTCSRFKLATVRTTPLGDRFTTNVPWDDPRGDGFVAYVARTLTEAQEAEALDSVGDSAELGRLYQYPRCCLLGYAEIEAGAYWADLLVQRSSSSRQSLFANKLAYLFDGASLFPDYFPCSLSCPETRELGKTYDALLREYGLGELADSLHERLGRPVLFGEGVAHQFGRAAVGDGCIRFDPGKVRTYRWSAAADGRLPRTGTLTLREDGPWVRVFNGDIRVGTLFLFDANR